MQTHPGKVNQFLAEAHSESAKQKAVREREQLMLHIVNLDSPYEGWGEPDQSMAEYRQARESGVYQDYGWTEEEYNEFTHRLRAATEKYWPELWRSMENEHTPAVERAWA